MQITIGELREICSGCGGEIRESEPVIPDDQIIDIDMEALTVAAMTLWNSGCGGYIDIDVEMINPVQEIGINFTIHDDKVDDT